MVKRERERESARSWSMVATRPWGVPDAEVSLRAADTIATGSFEVRTRIDIDE